jgi:antitoxin (DNA-binding transcriptional repressor) of toxin-antitoxin stability system
MYKVGVDDAQKRLLDLVNAALNGEDVFIVKDDEQTVHLTPVIHPAHRPQFGSAKGLIEMSSDFDAPLEDFAEYME